MRLTLLLTMFFSFTAIASVSSQSVTLKLENASLRETIKELKNQTGVYFVFNEEEIANLNVKLNMVLTNEPFEKALDRIFEGLPFSYEYAEGVVIVKPTPQKKDDVKLKLIKGKVVDTDGMPLPGVSVVVEGTTRGVASDVNGLFQMMIENKVGQKLLFSFVGMEQKVITWQGQDSLHVVMKYSAVDVDEVVVTGYQTLNRRESASAVSVVKTDDIYMAGAASIDQMLQGQVPGLMVMNTSGEPSATPKIRIRGTSTINGNKAPVWVVDGVILEQDVPITASELNSEDAEYLVGNAISGISPQDIESITVLKDASATAIYGVKAANGVIVLTTKKGRAGKPTVSYHGEVVLNERPSYRNFDRMNSAERMQLSKDIFEQGLSYNSNISLDPDDSYEGLLNELVNRRMSQEEFALRSQEMAKRNTDWFDVLFRNSFSMNHHLSFSGGSKQYTYYVSLGVTDDKGLVKETDYQRYNLNAKIDLNPSARLNLGFGIDLSKQKSDSYSMTVDPFKYAYFANPYETLYNSDGSYRSDRTYFNLAGINDGNLSDGVQPPSGFNIMREMKETSSSADNTSGTVRVNLGYDIIEKLKISGLASYTYYNNKVDDVKGRDTYAAFLDRLYFDENNRDWIPYGSITQTSSDGTSYNVRGQLEYRDVFGDAHRIAVLGGAELRGDKSNRTYAKRFGYDDVTGNSAMPMHPNPQPEDVKRYADLIDQLSGEVSSESRFASFYASLDYSYLERYLLSVTFRTDGSNNFGSDEQFNPTWSLGLAWHLDEERFMYGLHPVVNRLTLRAAMGYTGNIVKSVSKDLVLNYSTTYWDGLRTGSISKAPNPKVRWEKTKDMKIALDFGLFEDRVSGLVEAYYRKSSDIVSTVDVLSTTGFSGQGFNTSEIKNKGIEGTLRVKILDGKDFKFNVAGNIAWNRNILSKYSKKRVIQDGRYEGFPLESVFAGRYTGIDPRDGVYTYELRPDAQIYKGTDLQAVDNYRYYLGTSISSVTGGFNVDFSYRNLRLNVGGVVSSGAKLLNMVTSPASYEIITSNRTGETPQTVYSDLYRNHLNVSKDMVNRWTPERTTGVKYPRIIDFMGDRLLLDQYNVHSQEITKGAYLENVSFLRIKNISLYYDIPQSIVKSLGLSSVGFSFTMNNFITFTNYSGIDPETPGTTYPITRSMTLGVNVGF